MAFSDSSGIFNASCAQVEAFATFFVEFDGWHISEEIDWICHVWSHKLVSSKKKFKKITATFSTWPLMTRDYWVRWFKRQTVSEIFAHLIPCCFGTKSWFYYKTSLLYINSAMLEVTNPSLQIIIIIVAKCNEEPCANFAWQSPIQTGVYFQVLKFNYIDIHQF